MKYEVYNVGRRVESRSNYVLSGNIRTFHWIEMEGYNRHTGICGTVRGSDELDALNRLRECFPFLGMVSFVSYEYYSKLDKT